MRQRKLELGSKNLVGARVTEARQMRGMKQVELLARLQTRGIDISIPALSLLEGQKRPVTDIELAALSCHGNPVHPDPAEAKRYDDDFRNTVKEGIAKVNIFTDLCVAGEKAMQYSVKNNLSYLEARSKKVEYIKKAIMDKISLFGSREKA